MSTEITIYLSDYLEECQKTLEDNGYKVFKDDFDVQKYYEKNFVIYFSIFFVGCKKEGVYIPNKKIKRIITYFRGENRIRILFFLRKIKYYKNNEKI